MIISTYADRTYLAWNEIKQKLEPIWVTFPPDVHPFSREAARHRLLITQGISLILIPKPPLVSENWQDSLAE